MTQAVLRSPIASQVRSQLCPRPARKAAFSPKVHKLKCASGRHSIRPSTNRTKSPPANTRRGVQLQAGKLVQPSATGRVILDRKDDKLCDRAESDTVAVAKSAFPPSQLPKTTCKCKATTDSANSCIRGKSAQCDRQKPTVRAAPYLSPNDRASKDTAFPPASTARTFRRLHSPQNRRCRNRQTPRRKAPYCKASASTFLNDPTAIDCRPSIPRSNAECPQNPIASAQKIARPLAKPSKRIALFATLPNKLSPSSTHTNCAFPRGWRPRMPGLAVHPSETRCVRGRRQKAVLRSKVRSCRSKSPHRPYL